MQLIFKNNKENSIPFTLLLGELKSSNSLLIGNIFISIIINLNLYIFFTHIVGLILVGLIILGTLIVCIV